MALHYCAAPIGPLTCPTLVLPAVCTLSCVDSHRCLPTLGERGGREEDRVNGVNSYLNGKRGRQHHMGSRCSVGSPSLSAGRKECEDHTTCVYRGRRSRIH